MYGTRHSCKVMFHQGHDQYLEMFVEMSVTMLFPHLRTRYRNLGGNITSQRWKKFLPDLFSKVTLQEWRLAWNAPLEWHYAVQGLGFYGDQESSRENTFFKCLHSCLTPSDQRYLPLKHESRILGQWTNPASGSRKSQASFPWAKHIVF